MPERSTGDAAQIRLIGEQIADAAIVRFASQHPELGGTKVTAEIPPPLKWAAIIASAVLTIAASSGLIWLVSSVSEMSVTLGRMDERMAAYAASQEKRIDALESRTETLEAYHREKGER